MSYASRLIADSAPSPPRAAPVARLDVEVIEETGRPAMPDRMVQSVASPPRIVPEPDPIPARPVERAPVAPDAGPDAFEPSDPRIDPIVTARRVEHPAVETARRGPDGSSLPEPSDGRGDEATSIPMEAPIAEVTTVTTSSPARVPSASAAPSPPPPADDGIPWRRLAGTELATGTGPAPAADDTPVIEGRVALPPARRSDDAPAREPDRPPRREPEIETMTLSIGSIEVIVDGGPAGAAAAPVVTAAPAPARVIDDPIMRLRRQYVTWPDGD